MRFADLFPTTVPQDFASGRTGCIFDNRYRVALADLHDGAEIARHAFSGPPKMRCNGADYSTNLLVIYKSTLDLSFYFRLTMVVVRYLAYISYCNVPRIVVFDSYFRVS